jgi:hypothetical protein
MTYTCGQWSSVKRILRCQPLRVVISASDSHLTLARCGHMRLANAAQPRESHNPNYLKGVVLERCLAGNSCALSSS